MLFRMGQVGEEVLVFRHPLAGIQLVKGTIEPGEEPRQAALRELEEEAGIRDAEIARSLGTCDLREYDQVWAVFEVKVSIDLPDQWSHWTEDGGGHDFFSIGVR
jgi:8-oxo-dGTP pyrophosphatase MutT (NUDIX family)